MGFPAILSTSEPFQICIFNRKYSKLMFQMALSWWEKGLWQICMHHWTVHTKVESQKCPWDVRSWWESIPLNGPIHKIWHFSRFAVCITIGLFWRKTNKRLKRYFVQNKSKLNDSIRNISKTKIMERMLGNRFYYGDNRLAKSLALGNTSGHFCMSVCEQNFGLLSCGTNANVMLT